MPSGRPEPRTLPDGGVRGSSPVAGPWAGLSP